MTPARPQFFSQLQFLGWHGRSDNQPRTPVDAVQRVRDAISGARRVPRYRGRSISPRARLSGNGGRTLSRLSWRSPTLRSAMICARWFTEGFETADLKDAKALLDEVG